MSKQRSAIKVGKRKKSLSHTWVGRLGKKKDRAVELGLQDVGMWPL